MNIQSYDNSLQSFPTESCSLPDRMNHLASTRKMQFVESGEREHGRSSGKMKEGQSVHPSINASRKHNATKHKIRRA
eukprot:c40928_g1_i1 orf=830-1060(-)